MFNPTLQTYEDGTEFTLAHFAGAMALGAVAGTGVYLAVSKFEQWKLNRWMKKNNWGNQYNDTEKTES